MVPELSIRAPEGARTEKMSGCGKVVPRIFGRAECVCSVSRGYQHCLGPIRSFLKSCQPGIPKNATFAEEKKLVPPVCRKDSGVDFHTTDMHGGVD